MSSYTTKNGYERLERFENSWETNAADVEDFGDVTLAELRTDITDANAKKAQIALAEEKVKRLKIEHKDLIAASMKKCDYIVRAVEGDRRFGPDSALYAGFGYIRASERKKGGRRKAAAEK